MQEPDDKDPAFPAGYPAVWNVPPQLISGISARASGNAEGCWFPRLEKPFAKKLHSVPKWLILPHFQLGMYLLLLTGFIIAAQPAASVEVKGPDGYAMLIGIAIMVGIPVLLLLYRLFRPASKPGGGRKFWKRKKLVIELVKDRIYYPDLIKMTVTNKGNADIDLEQPLLMFRNMWGKRKFRIKGTNRFSFYPLLLEPGKSHEVTIDLNHFYKHDKRLKKYPRITVVVSEVNGKRFRPQSIMLRKTLFR